MAVASLQLLLVAWISAAPFAWVWGCVCLFFFAVPIVLSNAMVLALDPLPRIAGVASSIIGTIQNVIGASGAILGATIYNGTLRNAVMIIGGAGIVMKSVWDLATEIEAGQLVPILLPHSPRDLAINALAPPHRMRPPKSRAFINFIAERLSKMPPAKMAKAFEAEVG